MNPPALLLSTDLDRTLLPNGSQPESPGARETFGALAARDGIGLVYVTGRDLALMEAAIAEFSLPVPDLAITDVGTCIRESTPDGWVTWDDWTAHIAEDWGGSEGRELAACLADFSELRLQAESRQGVHKLSYELDLAVPTAPLFSAIADRLEARGVRARLVASVDDLARVRLLDILPRRADKERALRWVMAQLAVAAERVLFAGDSGNDLTLLASEMPAVLVANADDALREEALRLAAAAGTEAALHIAVGGFRGMNGCYAAGILEGFAHFHPDRVADLEGPAT